MSLINDALKRASQIKPQPPTTAEPETPLRAVDYGQPNPLLQIFLPGMLVLVLALAAWFFLKSWQAGRIANLPPPTVPVLARELSPASPERGLVQPPASGKTAERMSAKSAPPEVTSTTAARAPSELPIRDTADTQSALPKPIEKVVSAVEPAPTNIAAAFTEPPKPTFPPVRLQGVFYRAHNPSVMINSKTAFVGDKVGSIKVLAITRDSVTLQWNGETKVLTLEE